MQYCTNCGMKNEDSSNQFCVHCGARLTKMEVPKSNETKSINNVCIKCGAIMSPKETYCTNCGSRRINKNIHHNFKAISVIVFILIILLGSVGVGFFNYYQKSPQEAGKIATAIKQSESPSNGLNIGNSPPGEPSESSTDSSLMSESPIENSSISESPSKNTIVIDSATEPTAPTYEQTPASMASSNEETFTNDTDQAVQASSTISNKSNVPSAETNSHTWAEVPLIATASSIRSDEKTSTGFYTYNPKNVLDMDINTAWVEGAPGNGEGEWLQLSTADGEPANLSKLSILAGYPKSTDIYYKNSRPKDVLVEFSDNNYLTFQLKDEMNKWQIVPLKSAVLTQFVKITIVSVYPGSTYTDTCISEVDAS